MGLEPEREQRVLNEDVISSARKTSAESQHVGAEFLVAEVNIALTFIKLAEETSDRDVRIRNYENARAAYHTIKRFLPTVPPACEERRDLSEKFASLREQLAAAGYCSADE